MNPQLAINILEESIQHWERMIEWMRKNPNIKRENFSKQMFEDIGENYYGEYCACCKYTRPKTHDGFTDCDLCPIVLAGFDKCDNDCVNEEEGVNPYFDVVTASGARKVQKAIDMRDFLFKVQEHYKQRLINDNR